MRRRPSVSGQFYYADPQRLTAQIEGLIPKGVVRERAIGALSPHAGLMYSGHVAGAVYSSILLPKTFVLIGPNHTGLGPRLSLWSGDEWEIPTGTFLIDKKLSHRIAQEARLIEKDSQAHLYEHSLEVQLPFIGHLKPDARIVPIVAMYASLEELKETAEGIARAIKDIGYDVVVVASSDMSHYLPDSVARKKDNLAIERILALDPEGLYKTIKKHDISMCGYMPAIIMLYASIMLGAREARLVKYSTSGDVSGDLSQVVGYAGIIVK